MFELGSLNESTEGDNALKWELFSSPLKSGSLSCLCLSAGCRTVQGRGREEGEQRGVVERGSAKQQRRTLRTTQPTFELRKPFSDRREEEAEDEKNGRLKPRTMSGDGALTRADAKSALSARERKGRSRCTQSFGFSD